MCFDFWHELLVCLTNGENSKIIAGLTNGENSLK